MALIFCVTGFADSPPDWKTYFITFSNNGVYLARISPEVQRKADEPWNWSYKIEVAYRDQPDKILWKQKYHHPGYSGGFLSDDGQYFAYIEFWYNTQLSLIKCYSASDSRSWVASDLNLLYLEFPKTVSHRLWLERTLDTQFIYDKNRAVGITVNTLYGPRSVRFGIPTWAAQIQIGF